MIRLSITLLILMATTIVVMLKLADAPPMHFLTLPILRVLRRSEEKNVSLPDSQDLSTPFHNPSLLNRDMHHRLVVNYVNYFADVNYGYFSIAKKYREKENLAFGIHYMNYGKFTEAGSNGVKNGTFNAADYAFNIMYSRKLDSIWTVGINAKPILSTYEKYTSVGLVFDLGINYYNPEKLFSASLVLRNIGSQIKPYYENDFEPVPFEIVAGITQKLRYAPLAFSITAHQLQKPDLTYVIDEQESTTITQTEIKVRLINWVTSL
ncbi:MAG: type IX secretion system protein PorQ [Bacteroidales bacterium]|nr:type IX secretion system protein PorQ [Bacteroidales bacterium]